MTVADHEVPTVTVHELTEAESIDLFERVCQKDLGASTEEFLAAYDADAIPEEWDMAAVVRVEFRLPFIR